MTNLSTPPAAAASPAVPTAPRRLSALLAERATQEGIHPTAVDGVQLLRATRAVPRAPLVYEPCIVIIGQGSKIGYLGEERYCYDIDHYLVLSVPLPFECETHASPDAPLLGLSIALRPALVQELLLDLDENERGTPALPRGISTAPMCAALEDASCRLLASLGSPSESRILGPQLVREIVFRVLQGPYGEALRSLAARHGHFSKMARVLKRMHADYAEALDIETLARDAHMSVSNFHHNFKAVTSNSPLQYLKSIRLHKARMLMAHDGLRASAAALRVGYESVSQFNREFKRAFGASPGEDIRLLQERMGLPPRSLPDDTAAA